MQIRRTVTILIEPDDDLQRTVQAFREVKQNLSEPCYNGGKPLNALALQRGYYHQVKGVLNAQMTISAIRLVAGAYHAAESNKHSATRPFLFKKASALFLIGKRGRDASFLSDGKLSIWTVAGRKHLAYTVPEHFLPILSAAKERDSLTVVVRNGKLIGRLALTLEVAEPAGVLPVGIDLNETNALVAVDPDGRELFISGKAVKVKNRQTVKTRNRLKKKLAARKAQHQDTRSVRRVVKRLGRKQRNRTRTFAQQSARQLIDFAPEKAVLVFEDLQIPQPQKGKVKGKALRRRLSLWQHGLIRECVESLAEEHGMLVTKVNPAYTSQTCSRCGLRGVRKRHTFKCPPCGYCTHADLNAAVNIRNRYTVLRYSAPASIGAEALSPLAEEGKPLSSDIG
jgi:putative transposase